MAKDRAPSFQFYPRDFIADSDVQLMSLEERGAYITLLCMAWMSDEPGVIEDDDARLARLSGAHSRWKKLRPAVSRAFNLTVRPGFWVQERMVEERAEQVARYEEAVEGGRSSTERLSPIQRSERAKKAAAARWGTDANPPSI